MYARNNISIRTFICEYKGEVLPYQLEVHNESLSLGRLLPKVEFAIVTDKFANEGRFVAGIPSYCKKLANCKLRLF